VQASNVEQERVARTQVGAPGDVRADQLNLLAGLLAVLPCAPEGERHVVDPGDLPAATGAIHSIASGAAANVQRPAGRQGVRSVNQLDEVRDRFLLLPWHEAGAIHDPVCERHGDLLRGGLY
jgi:hypothetical protein